MASESDEASSQIIFESQENISPRKETWGELGYSSGMMSEDGCRVDEKENLPANPNSSFPSTTQDLHLELTETESASIVPDSLSLVTKLSLKRLHNDGRSEATPEKTRKIVKTELQELDRTVSINSNDNSIVILDNDDSLSHEIVDISTDTEVDKSCDKRSQDNETSGSKSPSLLHCQSDKSASGDTRSGEETELTSKTSDRSPECILADDEMSRHHMSSSGASGRPLSSLNVHSPEVSSLHHDHRTSTPGHEHLQSSPRQPKLFSSRDEGMVQTSPETEISEQHVPSTKQKIDSFKVPNESPSSDMAFACIVLKMSEVQKLTELLRTFGERRIFVKKGNQETVVDMFSKVKSVLDTSHRRISDVSSLSSQSHSTSSSGYVADVGSSGSSTLTSGSSSVATKRDRLSVCPDLAIEKHHVISPLPATLQKCQKTSDVQTNTIGATDQQGKIETATMVNPKHEKTTTLSETPREPRSKRLLPRHIRDSTRPGAAKCVDSDQSFSAAESNFIAGTKVFAKWVERTDVRYWPGFIKTVTDDDKFLITFDDGFERTLKAEDLIRVEALQPGQQVNVSSENDATIYRVAVLLSHPDLTLGNDVEFLVEFEAVEGIPLSESKLVSYRYLHLSDDQAKMIKSELGGFYTKLIVGKNDISLDNVLQSKRKIKPATPLKDHEVMTPGRRSARKRTDSATSRGRRKKLEDVKPVREKPGGENVETSAVENEDESSGSEIQKFHKRGTGRSRATISTTEDDTTATMTPKQSRHRKGAKLFDGMTFILTQSAHPPEKEVPSSLETETEEEAELDDDNHVAVAPIVMNRKKIKNLLIEHGAKMIEEFPGPKSKISKDVILISDRHCRTMKYLMSIVYGFQLINFQWVLQSVASGTKLPLRNYVLPVGFSSVYKKEIERDDIGNLKTLFNGAHILIASLHKSFANDWKPILTRMGSSVSVRTQGGIDRNLSSVDVVLVDAESPKNIFEDARVRNIPIVSSMWIIQSIINGKKLPTESFQD